LHAQRLITCALPRSYSEAYRQHLRHTREMARRDGGGGEEDADDSQSQADADDDSQSHEDGAAADPAEPPRAAVVDERRRKHGSPSQPPPPPPHADHDGCHEGIEDPVKWVWLGAVAAFLACMVPGHI
jgi:hypothetical protein